MIKRILSLVFILATFVANAQNAEMADSFRQEGKIYVVIAVMGIVFLSIAGVLVLIEKRISKLEKEVKEKNP
jgi:NADH:ubiquinone oxidoreductase subunit 2 (subunit N)